MINFVSRPFVGIAALFWITWVGLGIGAPSEDIWLGLVLIFPLVWLCQTDLNHHEIPDLASGAVAMIGIAFLAILQAEAMVLHLACGLLVTAFLWAIGELFYRWRGVEGLGIGDAKLLGALVVVLGPMRLPELLFLSSLGGIVAILTCRFHGRAMQKGIPFGPFIAYAGFILVFEHIFFF